MKSSAGGRREKLLGGKAQSRSETMKKPWSPNSSQDNVPFAADFTCLHERESEAELTPEDCEEKKEREKKHTSFTLCSVCNIQLNSAAQAQIHYNGKSHQKRLKQLSNGNLKNDHGGTCQSPALPALVRPPAPALQPSLDIKPFLPFPLDTAAAVNLFPNFNAFQNKNMHISWPQFCNSVMSKKMPGLALGREDSKEVGTNFGSLLIGEMDPIQKAVINHTFGVPLPHRRKQIISCNICQLRFNSDSQAAAHYKGTKHAKKLKALEAMKNKQKSVTTKDSAKTTFTSITTNTINTSSDKTADNTAETPAISRTTMVEIRKSSVLTTEITSKVEKLPSTATSSNTCSVGETEEEKAKRLLYCSLCKVAVNSASQLEAHNSGTKHKTMLEARNGSGTIKAFPRAGVKGKAPINKGNTGLQNKTFHCEICDVHVNSETQLKQHISSRRHKDRAAGKPPKPKYSPYNKLQKGTHPLGVKLVFSKEPSKPMPPRILPNPLAAAAAAAAVAVNSPFSLRTAPPATLFQTSALPPALLRPAPGPIRTTHTPVLFAPY
ncbi:zinc finger protein 385D isoform X1 [Hemicordylus capensis]|uniref:zinc finger protein 385D isoform X1 n=2 Tax=Hemicordylus capensis TaxID=884348 RepID=UPI0023048862|nr:zinc finger protein 385D isoform X1 [Hemicordylus capensis]